MSSENDAELHRRLMILQEAMKEGKVKFSAAMADGVRDSLMAVRIGADGKVDLSTVDSRVRALALAVTSMHDREETKKVISLNELQRMYFSAVEINFHEFHKLMIEEKSNPHDVASFISSKPDLVSDIMQGLPNFLEVIQDLWAEAHEISNIHAEDMQCLKGVFGGDLFPSYEQNIASTCGVYVDTILLPDPFMRTNPLFTSISNSKKVYYLVKHALNILQYKDLALAYVDPPIVAIVPDSIFFNEWDKEFLTGLANQDTLHHMGKLFGRTFTALEEIKEFIEPLQAPADAIQALRDKHRLLFDIEWTGSPEEQLIRHIKHYSGMFGDQHAGRAILFSSTGRMFQANDTLFRSRRLHGTPIIDAPTSWRFLQWKLEYDAERLNPDAVRTLHITRGLQNAVTGKMAWLGNVPASALIEMRKEGALPEIRAMLSTGISEILQTNPDDFNITSNKVISNIQFAFDSHLNKIKELQDKQIRFGKVELATCMTYGFVEIAAACGVPLVSLIKTVMEQTIGVPNFKERFEEIPAKYAELESQVKKLEATPVGLFFKHAPVE
ncbi:hypothetical protein [Sporomusa sp.]|uniref:hypothetical protein n=1 Tax=Sporomusa sp. TaxID=2078658 RepID=UPI002B95CB70|nr:hypothetical protein [Sporomusa sp.]HWR43929.1 hypothetical protein [Sporomusa sp.]